jgi:hypothetical protein
VEYSLKEPYGYKIIEALTIMQNIGIDYLIQAGKEELLQERKII